MKKFIYFLQDSPKTPNEIHASSKVEVKSLLLESLPDESHILAIYTQEEFNLKFYGKSNISLDDDDDYNEKYQDSNDFFNSVISQVGNEEINEVEKNSISSIHIETQSQNVTQNISNPTQQISEPTYFEDDGISFKLENGKLYRKRWQKIDECSNKMEYRILRKRTGRECSKEDFEVEILDWVEFQQK